MNDVYPNDLRLVDKIHRLQKYYGCNQNQAAKKLGVSRQAVSDALKRERNRRCVTEAKVIYPGLRDYINANYIRYGDFLNECKFSQNTARKYFSGKAELRKSTIDHILSLTGMTYEEAFGIEGNDACPS